MCPGRTGQTGVICYTRSNLFCFSSQTLSRPRLTIWAQTAVLFMPSISRKSGCFQMRMVSITTTLRRVSRRISHYHIYRAIKVREKQSKEAKVPVTATSLTISDDDSPSLTPPARCRAGLLSVPSLRSVCVSPWSY